MSDEDICDDAMAFVKVMYISMLYPQKEWQHQLSIQFDDPHQVSEMLELTKRYASNMSKLMYGVNAGLPMNVINANKQEVLY